MSDGSNLRRNASAFIRANKPFIQEQQDKGYYLHSIAQMLTERAGFPIGYSTLRSVLSREHTRTAPAGEKNGSAHRRDMHQRVQDTTAPEAPRRVIWNPNPDPKELL